MNSKNSNRRLIETGIPCHQIGAETQRERGMPSALPPLYFLHVWWARRPLTPSRAAILASLLPENVDTDQFLRDLGIELTQVKVNGIWWTITDTQLKRLEKDEQGEEMYRVDYWTLRWLERENKRRKRMREFLLHISDKRALFTESDLYKYWINRFKPIPEPYPKKENLLEVRKVPARPAEYNALMEIAKSIGKRIPNLYGYDRAYTGNPPIADSPKTILDPTAGGGSIPFEAVRMGHQTIANELNPVASIILKATLEYPVKFGKDLVSDVKEYGYDLINNTEDKLNDFFNVKQPLPEEELLDLQEHLIDTPELIEKFDHEETTTFLFVRQVNCPHCGGEAPLLNSLSVSKKDENKWGIIVVTDGKKENGTVNFETYRLSQNKESIKERLKDPTVSNGVGQCVHCQQAISSEEIKLQARGESANGKWHDRLYCVVGVRYQPKLKNGEVYRYKSGKKEGRIRTEKITYFRPPNKKDIDAINKAQSLLNQKWSKWEKRGLIPTEKIPEGNDMRPVIYGMERWCDMFTARQLLGHLTLVEELNRLKPQILGELGEERGKAVITYLQFIIDKGVDYNSKQTTWIEAREVVGHTFSRHDYSIKWTFSEMIFVGPNSGVAWGLNQISEALAAICDLLYSDKGSTYTYRHEPKILNQTAAHLPEINDTSIDLVCMDPPYYNNVQYAELSDYFYVWQKRTLGDLYPDIFSRRLTNKQDEAVANPARDSGNEKAEKTYEKMMGEIFEECSRVLKDDGLMTLMFTHKKQEAWEALTKSLIENKWIISSAFPVESEGSISMHQKNVAAAASSVFLSCRKQKEAKGEPEIWSGFGGTGVQHQVREAVQDGLKEFQKLDLNPVDEMVASYGRALRVLSQNWPVLDGDKEVSPIQAMNEASRVVAEHQIERITEGRMQVADLTPEAAMALTLYGIYGLSELPYDDALNLSRSLRISLENASGGYRLEGRMIGINKESRSTRRDTDTDEGYYAPLVRSGSKLRLVLPNERHPRRIDNPQTEWDILQGLILAYREGDVPVARAYLQEQAGARESLIKDLLKVWTREMGDEELRKEGLEIEFGLGES